ncbi:hypothetical protein KHA96_13520 [Bacillus sp. FJAT-49711]|uniref:hypothetical protein n=1 Tax=Bacillus sp. FJAT-49711 TaxID=2833585 RepID=UPI001BC8E28E|nr:hypothetical protein [Bacillus sp. FJAT-49711]MBS4219340.1 hypothetical protein [Bacillus sp. FJAT-49711]
MGDKAAFAVMGEIFVNEGLEVDRDHIQAIDKIEPSEGVELSWKVEKITWEEPPQLWMAVNPKGSPLATS